jgi:hypothetical protein
MSYRKPNKIVDTLIVNRVQSELQIGTIVNKKQEIIKKFNIREDSNVEITIEGHNLYICEYSEKSPYGRTYNVQFKIFMSNLKFTILGEILNTSLVENRRLKLRELVVPYHCRVGKITVYYGEVLGFEKTLKFC